MLPFSWRFYLQPGHSPSLRELPSMTLFFCSRLGLSSLGHSISSRSRSSFLLALPPFFVFLLSLSLLALLLVLALLEESADVLLLLLLLSVLSLLLLLELVLLELAFFFAFLFLAVFGFTFFFFLLLAAFFCAFACLGILPLASGPPSANKAKT